MMPCVVRIYGVCHMLSFVSIFRVIDETQLSRPAERSLATNILQHQNPQLIFIIFTLILHTDAFTHGLFYIDTFLHTVTFTHRHFATHEKPRFYFSFCGSNLILCERVARTISKSQLYFSFYRSNLISCERVARTISKSQFYASFCRSNLISWERVAFRGSSLAPPQA